MALSKLVMPFKRLVYREDIYADIIKKHPLAIKQVPYWCQTEQLTKIAFENGCLIDYVDSYYRNYPVRTYYDLYKTLALEGLQKRKNIKPYTRHEEINLTYPNDSEIVRNVGDYQDNIYHAMIEYNCKNYAYIYEKHRDLGEKRLNELIQKCPEMFKHVPKNSQTQELCNKAVKLHGDNIKYVLPKYVTYDMCRDLLMTERKYIDYVPHEYIDTMLEIYVLQSNGSFNLDMLDNKKCLEIALTNTDNIGSLQFLSQLACWRPDKDHMTDDMWLKLFENEPETISNKNFPEKYKTRENYCDALNRGVRLYQIPRIKDLNKFAVTVNGKNISDVKKDDLTNELIEIAKKNLSNYEFISRMTRLGLYDYITDEMYEEYVKNNDDVLWSIPEERITKKIIDFALDKDQAQIRYVRNPTEEMLVNLISKNPRAFCEIDHKHVTYNVALEAFKRDKVTLLYMPPKYKRFFTLFYDFY
uniref:DUF4116 domain-containing protein n=1 Tax=viral metagenome TaxID=1070528 RepID=A0A6C0EA77_9ZZZZ